jgi:hypothetical protein
MLEAQTKLCLQTPCVGAEWEQRDGPGTGAGCLHAGLKERRPKHEQLEGSPVPLCSLCLVGCAVRHCEALEGGLAGPSQRHRARGGLLSIIPLPQEDVIALTQLEATWKWTEGFWGVYLLEEFILRDSPRRIPCVKYCAGIYQVIVYDNVCQFI